MSSSSGSDVVVVVPPVPVSELPPNTTVLQNGDGGVVYLLGTVHVSRESGEHAKRLIELIKPDAVFLELCAQRQGILSLADREATPRVLSSGAQAVVPAQPPVAAPPPMLPLLVQALRGGQSPASAMQVMIGHFMERIGSQLDVLPGYEFRVAWRECARRRTPVILGDRPVSITLQRCWGALSLWERLRLIWSLLQSTDDVDEELISKLQAGGDLLDELVEELKAEFPSLYRPLVLERDLYLAARLRLCARQHPVVVAIVGLGHTKGIAEHWDEQTDIGALITVPRPNPYWRLTLVGGIGAVGVAAAAAVYVAARLAMRIVRAAL